VILRPLKQIYRIKLDEHPREDRYVPVRTVTMDEFSAYTWILTRRDANGWSKEDVVRHIYRLNGYHTIKLQKNTLKTGRPRRPNLGIVREYLENQSDADINEMSQYGIPDFLAYKLANWYELGRILPMVDGICVERDDEKTNLNIRTSVENVPLESLVKETIFVEVKNWDYELSESQKEWLEKYDQLNAHVVHIDADYNPSPDSQDGKQIQCPDCRDCFKNEHGLAIHQSKSLCGDSTDENKVMTE